jgi:hypothetical protein
MAGVPMTTEPKKPKLTAEQYGYDYVGWDEAKKEMSPSRLEWMRKIVADRKKERAKARG